MNKVEYVIFTEGDSNSIDTWSNVPYFFSRTLENLGTVVHRVDISFWKNANIIEKLIGWIYKIFFKIFHKLNKNNKTYNFNRTRFYNRIINKKIKQSFDKYKDANFISMNFSHIGGKYAQKYNTIMFCDWSIKYLIECQQKRTPGFFENKAIKRQEKEMLQAKYVVTLFPGVKKYMQNEIKRDILYLGNVINSEIIEFEGTNVIEKKYNSNRYLFIGRKRYLKSIEKLIMAVAKYKFDIKIDVIGLNVEDSKFLEEKFVKCYGYLSKKIKNKINYIMKLSLMQRQL